MSHASRVAAAAAAACTTCDSSGPLERGAIFKIRLPQKLIMTGSTEKRKKTAHTHTKGKAEYEIIHISARFNTVIRQITTCVFHSPHLALGLKIEKKHNINMNE